LHKVNIINDIPSVFPEGTSIIKITNEDNNPIQIFQSAITDISQLNENEFAVISRNGGVGIYDHLSRGILHLKAEKPYDKASRAWTCHVINNDLFLVGSTYGKIFTWRREDGGFTCRSLPNSLTDSIFSIVNINGEILIVDWRGNYIFFDFSSGRAKLLRSGELSIGAVYKIIPFTENMIVLGQRGGVYILNKDRLEVMEELDFIDTGGKDSYYFSDRNGYLIGSGNKTYFLSDDLQTLESIEVGSISFHEFDDRILVFNKNGLHIVNFDAMIEESEFLSFKQVKIGLLGHANAGKSCFIHRLRTGEYVSDLGTTFGNMVYQDDKTSIWAADSLYRRRYNYFDFAGQRDQMFLYVPKILDADIILIFFHLREMDNLTRAFDIHKEIVGLCSKAKFLFIQTHSEDKCSYTENQIKRIFIQHGFDFNTQLYKIDSRTGLGFESFRQKIIDLVDWNNVHKVRDTLLFRNFMNLLVGFFNNRTEMIDLNSSTPIIKLPKKVIINMLKRFQEKYWIEYIDTEKHQLLLMNHKNYSELQTRVATCISMNGGITNIQELHDEISDIDEEPTLLEDLLHHLLDYCDSTGLSINFPEIDGGEKKIVFPNRLSEPLEVDYKEGFEVKYKCQIKYKMKSFHVFTVLKKLAQMGLKIDTLKKNLYVLRHSTENIPILLVFDKEIIDNSDSIFVIDIKVGGTGENSLKLYSDLVEFFQNKVVDIIDLEQDGRDLDFPRDPVELLKKILTYPDENVLWDYKRIDYDLTDKIKFADFLKDISALSNASGYYISKKAFLILGITDDYKVKGYSSTTSRENELNLSASNYLDYPPNISLRSVPINVVKSWIDSHEIDSRIQVDNDDPSLDSVGILILERVIGMVCAIKTNFTYKNKKGNTLSLEPGDAWYRSGSSNQPLSQPLRNVLLKR